MAAETCSAESTRSTSAAIFSATADTASLSAFDAPRADRLQSAAVVPRISETTSAPLTGPLCFWAPHFAHCLVHPSIVMVGCVFAKFRSPSSPARNSGRQRVTVLPGRSDSRTRRVAKTRDGSLGDRFAAAGDDSRFYDFCAHRISSSPIRKQARRGFGDRRGNFPRNHRSLPPLIRLGCLVWHRGGPSSNPAVTWTNFAGFPPGCLLHSFPRRPWDNRRIVMQCRDCTASSASASPFTSSARHIVSVSSGKTPTL